MTVVNSGKLGIAVSSCGVRIFYDNVEITKGVGLNTAINFFGLWTDSSKASWRVEPLPGGVKLEIKFKDIPVHQTWELKARDAGYIEWKVLLHVEETLRIEEVRLLAVVQPLFKEWFSDRGHGNFRQFSAKWQDLCLGTEAGNWTGVRFCLNEGCLSAVALHTNDQDFSPFIQMTGDSSRSALVGFRKLNRGGKKEYSPGTYTFFAGEIRLFEKSEFLDRALESVRQQMLLQAGIGKKRGNKKIMLVNMPWYRGDQWGVRAGSRWPHIKDASEDRYLPFPFFLAYAASLLQKNGFEAMPLDAIAEQLTMEQFLERVYEFDPDLVVAEISTPSLADDINVCRNMATAGIKVCLCGPHTEIFQPPFLQEHRFVEYVLYGEYEFTLLDLCRQLETSGDLSRVNGLIWRDGERVIKNPQRPLGDINTLPWPDRVHLPMDRYWDLPGNIPFPSVQMTASRGCPFGCNFCLWPQVMYGGNSYRTRDIRDVVDEMECMVGKFAFKSVYFDDDTFNVGKQRMLDLCAMIRSRGLSGIPWAIMARSDLMDRELLEAMKSAGLAAVKYGVESYNQRFIDACGKKMKTDASREMIRLTRSLGIKVHLTFTFGLPGETKETLKRNIDYALSLEPDSAQFSILTPFPGTGLFESLQKQGRILTCDWSQYDGHHSCVFRPENVSPSDLEKAKRSAYHRMSDRERRKRGLKGDILKLVSYIKDRGWAYSLGKVFDYLYFVYFKRKSYLDGKG